MPRFHDIPQFTKAAPYRIDCDWGYMINTWIPEHQGELGLELDPDFQRAHVWSRHQQIRYVEFILRGGQSGKELYFNHPNWMSGFVGEFVLVDGKQRIEAARRFLHNEIPAFGSLYKEYTDRLPFLTAKFGININDLRTRAEVLQWYIDLNDGGIVHTSAEIKKVRRLLEEENGKV